jgi:hypothetical protein
MTQLNPVAATAAALTEYLDPDPGSPLAVMLMELWQPLLDRIARHVNMSHPIEARKWAPQAIVDCHDAQLIVIHLRNEHGWPEGRPVSREEVDPVCERLRNQSPDEVKMLIPGLTPLPSLAHSGTTWTEVTALVRALLTGGPVLSDGYTASLTSGAVLGLSRIAVALIDLIRPVPLLTLASMWPAPLAPACPASPAGPAAP